MECHHDEVGFCEDCRSHNRIGGLILLAAFLGTALGILLNWRRW